MDRGERYRYINVARGIAIICVVAGHAQFPEYVWRVVSFFHVPIFFFVSGYFYKESYSHEPLILIRKRLRSLYLPFIGYQFFFLLFHNMLFSCHLYSRTIPITGEYVKYYGPADFVYAIGNILTFGCTQQIIAGFWFLQSLFTVAMIFLLISWLTVKKFGSNEGFRAVMVLSTFLAGVALAKYGVSLPRAAVSSLVCIVFFYAGFLYHRKEDVVPTNMTGFLCAVLVLGASILLYNEHVGFANHEFVRFPYFVVNALLGIYAVFYLSKLVAARFACSTLAFVGANSLHILALHTLCFKLVAYSQILLLKYPIEWLGVYPVIDSSRGWWIAYTAVGVGLPALLCYVTRHGRESLVRVFLGRSPDGLAHPSP
jgi:fucose 4-O-acetylase-like acetyltransferase